MRFPSLAAGALAFIALGTLATAQPGPPGPWINTQYADASQYIASLAAGDLDKDGDADLFLGYQDLIGGFTGPRALTNIIQYSNGTDTPFLNAVRVIPSTIPTRSINCLALDLNRDGNIDIVEANGNPQVTTGDFSRVYLNSGNGRTFNVGNIGTSPTADRKMSISVSAGDIDRDGDPDLVFGNSGLPSFQVPYQGIRVYLNDGTGANWRGFDIPGSEQYSTYTTELGDLDEDGDLDIVVGTGDFFDSTRQRQPDFVYLNVGGGTPFVPAWEVHPLTDEVLFTTSVRVADLNGDDHLDVFAAVYGRDLETDRTKIYFGDGTGINWTSFTLPYTANLDSRYHTSSSLKDFDNDGDIDAFVSADGRSILYLNDGTGTGWTRNYISPVSYTNLRNEAADLDGDGDLDLVAGAYQSISEVYQNVGREIDVPVTSIDFGDVDSAGDPARRTVEVKNVVGGSLKFTGAGATISGPDAARFSLVFADVKPLKPNTSRTFTVAFDPIRGGTRTAILTFTTDDEDEPSVDVALTGNGLVGPTTDSDRDGYTDLIEDEYISDAGDAASRPPFCDVDGSGATTLFDALLLARQVTGGPLVPYDADVDANRDGTVDATDAEILFEWAAGTSSTPVIPKIAAP